MFCVCSFARILDIGHTSWAEENTQPSWMDSSSVMAASAYYASSRRAVSCRNRDGVVNETKRGVKHRHIRKHNYATINGSSTSSAASLLVLLALSFCASPRSTTVEAFVGLTVATSSSTRRAGSHCAGNGPTACNTKERRPRASPSLLRSRSSPPLRTVAPAAASPAASSPSPVAVDGSTVDGDRSVVAEQEEEESTGKKKRIRVNTLAEMTELLSQGESLFDLDARGDSQEMLEARQDEHPVLEALKRRAAAGTKPGSHGDGMKVGLAVEGGGMRGCVSAGMIAAVSTFGLMDSFDAVYGSSAGSLVGAYAIAAQEGMPRMGCSVYYDSLTGGGRDFIDTRQIFRAMGLGLFGTVVTRWRGIKELVRQKLGSPVLNLDYLLHDVVEELRPLDWDSFWKKQATQPLHVIASGVASGKAVVLSSKGGHFKTLRELTECMRASMLLPGITGPMVTLPHVNERLVDSQLYQPIPFQAALDDGCTHVLVIRSRPDGGNLLSKPKLVERLITRRFFKRKSKDLVSYAYMKGSGHKKLYAESVLTLNEAARATSADAGPYLMPMCLPASESEIARLERRRANMLEGVRKGYEHAHLLLRRAVPGHATASLDGREAALQAFPDSILDEEMDPMVREILNRSPESK